MKVVSVFGSPRRKGNSRILAEAMCSEFERFDVPVKRHLLNDINFSGCQACSACKGKTDHCIVQDDLSEVLADVVDSEIIILSSPVYWGDIAGQMKLFLDRSYSFLKPDFMSRADKHRLPPGKILVWIQAQGAGSKQFDDVFDRYNRFFSQLNYFESEVVLRACGVNSPGGVFDQPELLINAQTIVKTLMEKNQI